MDPSPYRWYRNADFSRRAPRASATANCAPDQIDAARDLAKPPVYIEAVGTQIVERTDWDQTTLTHEPQVLGQAASWQLGYTIPASAALVGDEILRLDGRVRSLESFFGLIIQLPLKFTTCASSTGPSP